MPDSLSLLIHDVAFGGQGVGRQDGKVVFVPFTIPGEEVAVNVVLQKKNFAEARLLSVLTPSPDRVAPRCPYFGVCGGCSYQHIAYPRQLELKAQQVEQTLRRVGHFASVPMRPIIASPKIYDYRNRIRVHIADGVIGFYAFKRHELIDIDRCPIASPEVNRKLRELRASPVHDGDYTLAERRDEYFAQTNDAVAETLIELVRQLLQPNHTTLIDAYCGAGFFAKQFTQSFNTVIGIEENEFAITQARFDAKPHEVYLCGDVAVHLGEVLSTQDLAKTTLILDPPALGLEPRALDFIQAAPPAEIVYVSCNPATLARDLRMLARHYALRSITPLDMFPQTAEIEAVAHLMFVA